MWAAPERRFHERFIPTVAFWDGDGAVGTQLNRGAPSLPLLEILTCARQLVTKTLHARSMVEVSLRPAYPAADTEI